MDKKMNFNSYISALRLVSMDESPPIEDAHNLSIQKEKQIMCVFIQLCREINENKFDPNRLEQLLNVLKDLPRTTDKRGVLMSSWELIDHCVEILESHNSIDKEQHQGLLRMARIYLAEFGTTGTTVKAALPRK
jgi:hypothetical protein